MTEDTRGKKKDIIQQSDKAIDELQRAEEETVGGRRLLAEFETRINQDILNLTKSRDIWVTIPDDELSNPPPELSSMVTSGSYLAGNMYDQSLRLRNRVHEYMGEIQNILPPIAANSTTSSSFFVVSLDAGKILAPTVPQMVEVLKEAETPTPIEQRKEVYAKLKHIEPRLAEKYDGAWKTLDDELKPDRFRQAAHSMREVLSDFEQTLAPDNFVKQTEWFRRSGQGQITQRLRVKCAIIGNRDDEGIDEDAIDAINNVMDDARRRYEELNKIAHARGNEENLFPLLESYLLSCEGIISGILELRQKFFQP